MDWVVIFRRTETTLYIHRNVRLDDHQKVQLQRCWMIVMMPLVGVLRNNYSEFVSRARGTLVWDSGYILDGDMSSDGKLTKTWATASRFRILLFRQLMALVSEYLPIRTYVNHLVYNILHCLILWAT